MTPDPQMLADRFAQLWNETDAALRSDEVMQLFAPDAVHWVRTIEARGHVALVQRVTSSHEKNVRDAGHRFRAQRHAQLLRDTVIVHWEMVRPVTGDVLALGLDLLQLDEHGRILRDYQFILA